MTGEWFDPRSLGSGLRGRRVHVLPAESEEAVRRGLTAAGFRLHVLEGSHAVDTAGLFAEAERGLGLPPGLGRHWDAFIDSVGEVVEAEARSAVLWRDADRSLEGDVQMVLEAVRVLDGTASQLAGEEGPRQLEVFLFGHGPGFALRGHERSEE